MTAKTRDEMLNLQYVIEQARAASPKAIAKLVALLKSEDDRVAFMAANAILDRGFGRPAQTIAVNADVKHYVAEIPALAASTEEWLKRVNGSSSGVLALPPKLDS